MSPENTEPSNTRTPPQIVVASDHPAEALSAFIAQELEHWGFDIRRIGVRTIRVNGLIVMTDGSSS